MCKNLYHPKPTACRLCAAVSLLAPQSPCILLVEAKGALV